MFTAILHVEVMACILILDDDKAVRSLLRAVLEPDGHTVFDAPNGHEARRIALAEQVDLVVADLHLLGESGIDTIIELRRHHPSIAIIATSGSSAGSGTELEASLKLGADAILPKPFRVAQARSIVGACLAGQAPAAIPTRTLPK